MQTELQDKVEGKQETFLPILNLVTRFRGAGFGNWYEVFAKQNFAYHIGEKSDEALNSFRDRLLNHRNLLTTDQGHDIDIFFRKTRSEFKMIYRIDGFPLAFINPQINSQMAFLLRGDGIFLKQGDRGIEDLEKDVQFLNNYFDLGLKINKSELSKNGERRLSLEKQKKVEIAPEKSLT